MTERKKSKTTITLEDIPGEKNKNNTTGDNSFLSNQTRVTTRITEDREAHTTDSFSHYYQKKDKETTGACQKLQKNAKEYLNCSGRDIKKAVFTRIPIIRVLQNYNVREDLPNDVIAGFTTSVMQIPQGMSFAMLAGLPPIHGLYTSFFPVLVYSLLGTSPHISMGCYAIQCMILNGVVLKHGFDPLDTVTVCALWAAIYLFLMGVFRLSSLMVFFSSKLVSGFTFGAAIHVLSSQLPYIFGIDIGSVTGFLIVFRRYILMFSKITETNIAVMCVGGFTALVLMINNEIVKPWMAKKMKYPLPMELILVISGASVSYVFDMNGKYDIPIIGDIPTGLPQPVLPKIELMGVLAIDALIVTLVGLAGTFSLAKLFASKKGADLDPQQECYAIALSNLFGSVFSCCNAAAAMARSAIQVNAGARTTMTALNSCIFLLPVLLYFGPYLSTIPKCVLSAIIIVSLKGMFLLIKDFFKACKTSKTDALMWLVPCLSTILLNIQYGLYTGVATAVVVLLYKEQTPSTSVLGKLPGTQMYVDVDQYPNAEEEPGVKLFKIYGSLYFSTRDYFDRHIKRVINQLSKIHEKTPGNEASIAHIVVDLSSLSSLDMDGGNKLITTKEELRKLDVNMYIVTGTGKINNKLDRLGIKGELNQETLFPSVQDAMAHLERPDVRRSDKRERKATV